MKVPFVNLGLQYQNLREEIISKFDEISKKGEYVLGNELLNFEKEFADYCGTKYSVGVGNGSDALSFSLKALNISKGDEVIIPCNSFIATAWTIANVGAKPVFVDVNEDFTINPKLIEKVITSKTKAIMPVHLTGRIANVDEINKIANNYNLFVIEDAAQAVGASFEKKRAGSFGITGCFSLHPLKNLHVHGDGGIITTNDSKIFKFLNQIRNHGLKNRDECDFWGYNSRLDNIQAAIARIKLPYLDQWIKKITKLANIYSEELSEFAIVPKNDLRKKSVYHIYMIQVEDRDKLKFFLEDNFIETKIHYPVPLHLQKSSFDLGYKKGDFPIAEKHSKSIISLPIYSELEENQIYYVIENIKKFFKRK